MILPVRTIFIGGGVSNTFAISNMLSNLTESFYDSSLHPSYYKIVVIDQANFFGGGIPWGRKVPCSSFFNNPARLTEPSSEFKLWVLENLGDLINYLYLRGGKVGESWIKDNQAVLESGNIDEVYFPRVFFGFFLEDKLSKAFEIARSLGIEVVLLEACVEKVRLNQDSSKTVLIRGNHGYVVAMTTRDGQQGYPKFDFYRQKEFFGSLETHNICLGISTFTSHKYPGVYNHPRYFSDLYEESKFDKLRNEIISSYSQKDNLAEVCVCFLGSSSSFLELLFYLYVVLELKHIVRVISISRHGKTRKSALWSNKRIIYKPKYLSKDINTSQNLITALQKEYSEGRKCGYSLYDVWCGCHERFVEIILWMKNTRPDEYEKYVRTGFVQVRKLTDFTNPELVALVEYLRKEGSLVLEKGRVANIESLNQGFIIDINKKNGAFCIECDIVVNTLGSDRFENLLTRYSLLRSICECGAEINDSGNGFSTDDKQQVREGLFVIGALAFGGNQQNINSLLRYTHLKTISSEAILAGRELALNFNKEYSEVGIPSWERSLLAAQERNYRIPNILTNDNRLVCQTDHFYVIVGWGAFVPGYLLIIPKDSLYASFGLLPDKYYTELSWLVQNLIDILSESYNEIANQFYGTTEIRYIESVLFEHGAFLDGQGVSCDETPHAHIMIKPTEKQFEDACKWLYYDYKVSSIDLSKCSLSMTELETISRVISSRILEINLLDICVKPEDICSLYSANNDIKKFPECTKNALDQGQPYIYFCSEVGGEGLLISAYLRGTLVPMNVGSYLQNVGLEHIIDKIILGSQFGREVIARLWGIEGNAWDWQIHENSGYENMKRTMTDLSSRLLGLGMQPESKLFGYESSIC